MYSLPIPDVTQFGHPSFYLSITPTIHIYSPHSKTRDTYEKKACFYHYSDENLTKNPVFFFFFSAPVWQTGKTTDVSNEKRWCVRCISKPDTHYKENNEFVCSVAREIMIRLVPVYTHSSAHSRKGTTESIRTPCQCRFQKSRRQFINLWRAPTFLKNGSLRTCPYVQLLADENVWFKERPLKDAEKRTGRANKSRGCSCAWNRDNGRQRKQCPLAGSLSRFR